MGLEDDIRTLGQTPLLDELGRDALRLIAFSAERLTLRPGQTLFREGDVADGGFVVTGGVIRLSRGEDGAGGTRLAQVGTLIGELALLTDTTRPATATAEGPAEVYRIARDLFLRLFDEYPELPRKLHARIADRLKSNVRDLKAIEATLRK